MRALPAVATVIALVVSGCATTAQGAVQATVSTAPGTSAPTPVPAPPTASPVATTPTTPNSMTSTPATSPDASPSSSSAVPPSYQAPPAPSAMSPTGSAVLLPPATTAPASSRRPLPPNPYELGGPAPVGSFVLGDSISLSAGVGPVLARLGYPVMGLVGQSIADSYLRTHLSSPLAQQAPAWVLELGTNNQAGPADVARLAGWVALIDSLRSRTVEQEVYWVTPHRPPSYAGGRVTWRLDAFNAELRRLDAKIPWLHVIDFDAVALGHPEWFAADGALHVHPDRAGQDVLVALIAGPDAAPADIPAPLLTSAPSGSAEPETFDNATIAPTAAQSPTVPSPTGLASAGLASTGPVSTGASPGAQDPATFASSGPAAPGVSPAPSESVPAPS